MRKTLLSLAVIIAMFTCADAQPSGSFSFRTKVGVTRKNDKPEKDHPQDKDVPNTSGESNGNNKTVPIDSASLMLLSAAVIYGFYSIRHKSSTVKS